MAAFIFLGDEGDLRKSYLARLNYVHQNLCGMAWFGLLINTLGAQRPGSSERLERRKSKPSMLLR
ncbi:MAG: hypothetical protein ABI967_09090 [bacterium]